jgi:hypothetical protein
MKDVGFFLDFYCRLANLLYFSLSDMCFTRFHEKRVDLLKLNLKLQDQQTNFSRWCKVEKPVFTSDVLLFLK